VVRYSPKDGYKFPERCLWSNVLSMWSILKASIPKRTVPNSGCKSVLISVDVREAVRGRERRLRQIHFVNRRKQNGARAQHARQYVQAPRRR
jgi:hypothetical protein